MVEKLGPPRNFKDFRKQSELISRRLAQQCIQYEARPIRLQHTREELDFIQAFVKFTEGRDAAATSLRDENARLKSQVKALKEVLTNIGKTTTAESKPTIDLPGAETKTDSRLPEDPGVP